MRKMADQSQMILTKSYYNKRYLTVREAQDYIHENCPTIRNIIEGKQDSGGERKKKVSLSRFLRNKKVDHFRSQLVSFNQNGAYLWSKKGIEKLENELAQEV